MKNWEIEENLMGDQEITDHYSVMPDEDTDTVTEPEETDASTSSATDGKAENVEPEKSTEEETGSQDEVAVSDEESAEVAPEEKAVEDASTSSATDGKAETAEPETITEETGSQEAVAESSEESVEAAPEERAVKDAAASSETDGEAAPTEAEESIAEETGSQEAAVERSEEQTTDSSPKEAKVEDSTPEGENQAPAEPKLTPEEAVALAQQTNIVQATYQDMRKDLPDFRSGDTVSVGYRVVEAGRTRIQNFEGVVIKVSSGHGLDKTFTVRKISSGVGVERIFPFHSPNIDSVKVLKQGKVRRAKLYYLRSRVGKATRIRERSS